RHGHRNLDNREADNGLDAEGKKQARAVAKYFRKRYKKGPKPVILSSPKKRCVETIAPLAEAIRAEIQISKLLTEQESSEDFDKMKGRVVRFLKEEVGERHAITILCSHGDWIPLAVEVLSGARVEAKKGSWIEIDLDKDEP